MILTGVGEVCVHIKGGEDMLLRPSLAAFFNMGSPEEIVDIATRALSGSFIDCLAVIYACSPDEDNASKVFGYTELLEGGEISYVKGLAEPEHIPIIANCLIRHGVIGVQDEDAKESGADGGEYSPTFDARKYASIAMAHLGLSERDAWNMTMTGLLGAIHSKYKSERESVGSKAPSKKELDATMEWYEQIKIARSASKD